MASCAASIGMVSNNFINVESHFYTLHYISHLNR